MRLLLLKAVGSWAAALARPEALRPCALAVRSIARQTLAWVNLVICVLLAECSDRQKSYPVKFNPRLARQARDLKGALLERRRRQRVMRCASHSGDKKQSSHGTLA